MPSKYTNTTQIPYKYYLNTQMQHKYQTYTTQILPKWPKLCKNGPKWSEMFWQKVRMGPAIPMPTLLTKNCEILTKNGEIVEKYLKFSHFQILFLFFQNVDFFPKQS